MENITIEREAEREFGEISQQPGAPDAPDAPDAQRGGFDWSFLKAKTGPGSIDDYIDHPLNFSAGRGVAQIIRGFTGLLGSLDLAIIDILIGSIQAIGERKKAAAPENGWNYVEQK